MDDIHNTKLPYALFWAFSINDLISSAINWYNDNYIGV